MCQFRCESNDTLTDVLQNTQKLTQENLLQPLDKQVEPTENDQQVDENGNKDLETSDDNSKQISSVTVESLIK